MTITKGMTITERKRAASPHQPVGRWIRADKRLAIYLRDSFRCLYCARDLHGADPRDVTLDHLVCKVVTACRSCNCSRGDRPVSRFASPEARKHIWRNVRRSLKRYRTLAKAILADECGVGEVVR